MKIKDIVKGVALKTASAIPDIDVKHVTCDSRKIKEGDMFIAFNGYSLDGYRFIGDAISNGAKVVVAEKEFFRPSTVIRILAKDTRRALPIMADNFFHHPSRRLKTFGVTGTNGKTTVTYIIESILKNIGTAPGVIGTINYRLKDRILDAKNTTPGPLELEKLLAEMVEEGLKYCVMEVSSHALDQHRVDSIEFDLGIFTNITSEHLDYHKSIENYFNAKRKLFSKLKEEGVAILNIDDEKISSLSKEIKKRRILTYGFKKDADISAKELNCSLEGSSFVAVTPKGSIEIYAKLMGEYNVSNILASIAASYALNMDLAVIKKGVESLRYIPGRLEAVDAGQPFKLFIDYAHTEAALLNVLNLLRKLARKNIITVFGCGGNRDRKKRPLMGNVACRFSDRVIITSDNPRFEKPLRIMQEVERGIEKNFLDYEMIEDRLVAIERALDMASPEDIVLIAGKGHEKYQVIEDKAVPFDDCKAARSILKRKYAGERDCRNNKGKIAIGRSSY